MILWISGIIEAEINASFFETMKFVQSKLNFIATNIDSGNAIQKIRIVFVINQDETSEYQKFIKKDKILDARVRINYDEFKAASRNERIEMFIKSIIKVLNKIKFSELEGFSKNLLVNTISNISFDVV